MNQSYVVHTLYEQKEALFFVMTFFKIRMTAENLFQCSRMKVDLKPLCMCGKLHNHMHTHSESRSNKYE